MRDDAIKDKADHVSRILPQISEQGQEYLKNVAQALLLVQNPAVSPLAGKREQDANPPVRENHSQKEESS